MQWTLLLVVNVLVVVLGVSTAVLGIFGETRRKNADGLNRMTGLGWGALVCLVLTLAAGITKEILTGYESKRQENENERLKGTITALKDTITNLQTELKAANDAAVDTRAKLVNEQLASQKTTDAIQAYVYDRLSLYTSRYVSSLGRMIAAASEGWLPSNKQEFFSPRSVSLVCRWLNAQAPAPAHPAMSWSTYYRNAAREYEDGLINMLNSFASRLSPDLIDSMSGVARSWLLTLARMPDVKAPKGFKPSPMICFGLFDARFEEAFVQLSGLVNKIAKAEKTFRLQSRMDDKLVLSGLRSVTLGSGRLSDSEVKIFLDS